MNDDARENGSVTGKALGNLALAGGAILAGGVGIHLTSKAIGMASNAVGNTKLMRAKDMKTMLDDIRPNAAKKESFFGSSENLKDAMFEAKLEKKRKKLAKAKGEDFSKTTYDQLKDKYGPLDVSLKYDPTKDMIPELAPPDGGTMRLPKKAASQHSFDKEVKNNPNVKRPIGRDGKAYTEPIGPAPVMGLPEHSVTDMSGGIERKGAWQPKQPGTSKPRKNPNDLNRGVVITAGGRTATSVVGRMSDTVTKGNDLRSQRQEALEHAFNNGRKRKAVGGDGKNTFLWRNN